MPSSAAASRAQVLHAALLLAAIASFAGCSGGNAASNLAKAPEYAPKGETKCGVTKSQAEPLIVEWPDAARGKLEAQVRRGLVAVRYEGCEMEVLGQCSAKGSYGYAGLTRKRSRVTMKDADELYANIPVGAARLESKLQKAGELNVTMLIVGRLEADRSSIRADELQGNCAGATHLITALTIGQFDFFAGADAEVGGGATVAGIGGGAKSASKREMLNEDGEESACMKSTAGDKAPPDGCGALLRVEVVPLVGAEPAAASLSPSHAAPPVASGRGTFRAVGLVWQAQPDGQGRIWNDAKTYCAELDVAGGGWRLPTKDELKALYDSNAPGAPHEHVAWDWSSSFYDSDPSVAWAVRFDGVLVGANVGHNGRARCVR